MKAPGIMVDFPHHRARAIARRSLRVSALLALAVLAGGCGLHVLPHHAAAVTARNENRKPAREPHSKTTHESAPVSRDPLAEAMAQARQHADEPYWPFRVAELRLESHAVADAEASLLEALRLNANYAPAMALLSKLYYESGRHEDALRVLEPAVTHPEGFGDDVRETLLAAIALHQDALGRSDLATETLRPLQHPDLRSAGSAMVYVALRGSYPDSATQLASEVMHKSSGSAANLNNYGITQLRAGDPQAARKTFLTAIDRDPALPGPYYNLAILDKFYLMDDASARGWFKSYWALSHDDPDSLRSAFSRGAGHPAAARGN